MDKKYEDKICRVCGEKTEQIFCINLVKAYICKKCENKIVRQSVENIYGRIK